MGKRPVMNEMVVEALNSSDGDSMALELSK